MLAIAGGILLVVLILWIIANIWVDAGPPPGNLPSAVPDKYWPDDIEWVRKGRLSFPVKKKPQQEL